MRARVRLAAAIAAALACALVAPAAHAEEDERAFSLSLSYARYTIPDHEPDGGVIGIDYERGLSDAVWLRGSVGGGLYYSDGPAYSGHAIIGLTYAFDVLKYVPYANVGVGAIIVAGDEFDTEIEPLIEIGGGVDFLRSREFSWGFVVRYETFTNETSFVTSGVRMTWRWGFF